MDVLTPHPQINKDKENTLMLCWPQPVHRWSRQTQVTRAGREIASSHNETVAAFASALDLKYNYQNWTGWGVMTWIKYILAKLEADFLFSMFWDQRRSVAWDPLTLPLQQKRRY